MERTMKKKQFGLTQVLNIKNKEKFMGEIQKEIKQEYQEKIKDKIKQKIKEIAMTQEILKKQKIELNLMLSGKQKIITKEEYLFG